MAAGLALLAYLARQLAAGREVWRRRASRSAMILLCATLLLAVLGVAVPALLWASSWVTWKLNFSLRPAAAVSSLTVITTYLGAVVALFWRNRTTIAKTAGTVTSAARKTPVNMVLPNSMIQPILMWICLAFLILVALLFCGWAATSPLVHSIWALAPAGALAVLAVVIDQTSLSLHPFYRRRLARAFAVRRLKRAHADVAVPYRDDEYTWLDTYATPVTGYPATTFAATANITGQDRTPPGRPAVPFMLAHDYIGGPATGWVHTGFVRQLLPRALRADLTTEAAMAISGAAFASAMGSQTRFFEVFLAIANARLGAWLPNPRFVALKRDNLDNWTIPGFPARRRLSYFAREIFGIHPSTGRLLLCTDGGHYDNLGLVELLRRRCKLIYCIDASGASQPLADALAGAITLAREELGVDITLDKEAFEPGLRRPGTVGARYSLHQPEHAHGEESGNHRLDHLPRSGLPPRAPQLRTPPRERGQQLPRNARLARLRTGGSHPGPAVSAAGFPSRRFRLPERLDRRSILQRRAVRCVPGTRPVHRKESCRPRRESVIATVKTVAPPPDTPVPPAASLGRQF